MLTVKMKNFRKWVEKEIHIPCKGITLLKGKSGSGKSSILNAIFWCLYGSLRKISRLGDEKAATEVSLCFGDVSITRKTKPNQLILQTQTNNYYEGDIAQNLIYSWFGTEEIWQISCYVAQGQRNAFLSSTNNARMDMLNLIAFYEEDPTTKIEKLANIISERTKERKNLEEQFKMSVEKFNLCVQESGLNNLDFSTLLSDENKISLWKNHDELSNSLKELQKKQILQEKNKEDLNECLQKKIAVENIQLKKPVLENSVEFFLETHKFPQDCSQLQIVLNDILKLDKYRTELSGYPEIVFENFTEKQLQESLEKEVKYSEQEKAAAKYGIIYDAKIINTRKAEIKETLILQDKIKKYQEFLVLKGRIESLKLELSDRKIDEVTYTLEDLQATSQKEFQYEKNYQLAVAFNVEYSAEKITERVASLSLLLLQNEFTVLSKIQEPSCPIIPEPQKDKILDEYKVTLEELRKEYEKSERLISSLEKACDILDCPNCGSSLIYVSESSQLHIATENIKRDDSELQKQKDKLIHLERDIASIMENIRKQERIEEEKITNYHRQMGAAQIKFNNELKIYNEAKIRSDALREKLDSSNIKEIILSDNEVSRIKDEISNLSNLEIHDKPKVSSFYIRESLRAQDKIEQLRLLQTEIDKYGPMEYVSGKIEDCEKLKKELIILESLVFYEKPLYSSVTIKEHLMRKHQNEKREKLQKEIRRLEEQYGNINKNELHNAISILDRHFRETKLFDAQWSEYQTKKNLIDERLLILQEESKLYENVQEDLTKTKKDLGNIIEILTQNNKLMSLHGQYQQLQILHQQIAIFVNHLAKAESLKQILIKCHCEVLESTVVEINNVIEESCHNLFENEISISLELFKTIKSTGVVKPQTNFNIMYQGHTFDGVNQLSGGEGDRVSLAVTLGFNKLNKFPLLFFDESLASLDQDIKNNVVENLQKTEKGVVVVMHDGIEGIFDDVIEI